MSNSDSFHKLLYQHEVLRAQHEIREQYLHTAGREVYENIGQVLSLVGIELELLEPGDPAREKQKIELIEELVRRSVRDLRGISNSLNADLEKIKSDGLIDALNRDLKLYNTKPGEIRVEIIGTPKPITASAGLILFRVLQEILHGIRNIGELSSLTATYKENFLNFMIDYKGEAIAWENYSTHSRYIDDFILTLFERINLIGGTFGSQQLGVDHHRIELDVKI